MKVANIDSKTARTVSHEPITNVWSTGRVPTEWKEGIIIFRHSS